MMLLPLLPLFLLLQWAMGGKREGRMGVSRDLLTFLPGHHRDQDLPATPIEPAWEAGKAVGGFLTVDNILSDPRTTVNPPRPLEVEIEEKKEDITEEEAGEIVENKDDNLKVKGDKGKLEIFAEKWKSNREKAKKIRQMNLKKLEGLLPNVTGIISDINSSKKGIKQLGEGVPRVKSDILAAEKDNKNEDFDSVQSYNSHFTPHITKDLYPVGYSVPNTGACTREGRVLVAILVISAPAHKAQREAIRAAWGREREGVVFSFLVGTVKGDLGRELLREATEHRDLIVSRVTDSYENLGLKTISGLDWVVQYCPDAEFVLKVDDDMFVQVDKLLELVHSLLLEGKSQKLVVGNISRGWRPVRNPRSKYYITEAQYEGDTYPDFATGPSYLVSRAAVIPLVEEALVQKYIHLEDVFITGVVAQTVGVTRRNTELFKNNAVRVPARFMGCTLLHTITIHKVDPEEQEEMHELSSNPDCGRHTHGDTVKDGDGVSDPDIERKVNIARQRKKIKNLRMEAQYLSKIAEKNKV